MKTLIVYGTKYGCTKRCSELLHGFNHGFIEPQINLVEIKKLAEIMTK